MTTSHALPRRASNCCVSREAYRKTLPSMIDIGTDTYDEERLIKRLGAYRTHLKKFSYFACCGWRRVRAGV
jgi:hypothetical protein